MEDIRKVKTVVVGCGMISNIYLKNLTNLFSITDVIGVCDLNRQAAEEKAVQYGIEKVYTLEEVCAAKEVELAVNLTAPSAHYSVIRQLLLAGKNVYTEKLLCFDLEQGRELVGLAEEKGLYLGSAPDTFLGAGLQTARKIIDCGLIGDVVSCIAAVNRNQPMNSEVFRAIRSEGGSFPYDVGVYYVTALLSLLGPVEKVTGFAAPAPRYRGRFLWNGDFGKEWELSGNNLQAASLLFKSGVIGSLHFNGLTIDDEEPLIRIYGTEGILSLGDPNRFDGRVTLIRSGEAESVMPFTHGFKGTPLYGAPTAFDWGGHRGLGAAELAWSMRLGRTPRAEGAFGLHTLEVFHGIDKSAGTGRTYAMTTECRLPRPLPSGYLAEELGGSMRADAETALTV